MTRDITEAQFRREVERRGWRFEFGGYIDIDGVHVYRFNARGDKRRTQLAYLIARAKKWGKNWLPLPRAAR